MDQGYGRTAELRRVCGTDPARRGKANTSLNNLTSLFLIIFSLLFFKYESAR
jgi:hypothetical protein